jgi:NADPH-dependent 7-cyano-7-deazaguanine reductase QueF
MRSIIKKELQQEVNVNLKLNIVILKSLVKVSSPTFVRIAIRFYGGGGVSLDDHCSQSFQQ